jgi:hypothetical protein
MIDAGPLALEQLAHGNPVQLIARGGSMRPLLQDGDRLLLNPDVGQAPVGSIVLKIIGQSWIIHRVIARLGPYRLLKGDAHAHADGWHPLPGLVARVTHAERRGHPLPLGGRPTALASAAYGALRRLPGVPHLIRRLRP